MSFKVKPHNEGAPEVQERDYYSGSTFKDGALLLVHSDGTFKECGADPSSVAAIALHDVGTGSGAEFPIGYKEFPPLKAKAVLLKPGMKLTAKYVGSVGTVGTAYGAILDSDGYWKVDFNETGTTQFRLVRSLNTAPLSAGLVEVVVITSVIQAA